jgi:hypothetical protein
MLTRSILLCSALLNPFRLDHVRILCLDVPHREQSQLGCLVSCFFGFSSYLKENTVLVGMFIQLFLRSQLVPHREQSQMAYLINRFFCLSSYLTENTVLVDMFSQLFLRRQLVLHSTLSPLEGPMSQMYIVLHAQCLDFCPILTENEHYWQVLVRQNLGEVTQKAV